MEKKLHLSKVEEMVYFFHFKSPGWLRWYTSFISKAINLKTSAFLFNYISYRRRWGKFSHLMAIMMASSPLPRPTLLNMTKWFRFCMPKLIISSYSWCWSDPIWILDRYNWPLDGELLTLSPPSPLCLVLWHTQPSRIISRSHNGFSLFGQS